MRKTKPIPEPSCPHGYTRSDLSEIFPTQEAYQAFEKWMIGQTMMICEGKKFNYELNTYLPDQCWTTPHGTVVYPWDVIQYLDGGEPFD